MSSKFIIIRVLLFVLLVVGTTSAMIAQDNDFTTWTKFKVNHLYENRNKSYISEEAQLEALPSLHYRPVLAAITTLSDGTTDFTSHAMEFDDEGNITYIEQPIGVFVNPEGYHLEYDKEHDKTYVIADAVIYNDYCAPACEIIQRKQGSKVSCELSISELSFDTKDKVLHLDKFRYNGVTCLGTDPITEKPVEEGMEGARLDIADFSEENNSLFTNTEEKLLKVIQSLQETLAKFEIEEPTKGGNQTLKLNELLEKYSKTVEDLDVAGKKVLVRCDFNVPLSDGKITSDKRIVASLPTIKYLIKNGAKVILCSHLGRPKGEFKPEFSLAPVAARLSELLGQEVKMAKDVVGESAQSLAASLKDGEVMLLENVRFHKEETKNDPEFSKKLASLADLYVNDAFGSAHRAHSSTTGVADYLPSACGYPLQKENEFQ